MFLSVYLSYLSIHPSIYVSIYLSVYLSIVWTFSRLTIVPAHFIGSCNACHPAAFSQKMRFKVFKVFSASWHEGLCTSIASFCSTATNCACDRINCWVCIFVRRTVAASNQERVGSCRKKGSNVASRIESVCRIKCVLEVTWKTVAA